MGSGGTKLLLSSGKRVCNLRSHEINQKNITFLRLHDQASRVISTS